MDIVLSTHLLVGQRLNTVWLDRIWEAGIPAVEIFCARQHLDYLNQAQVNELGYWFRDSKLKLHSLHSPMYKDDCWGRTGPSAVVDITETSKPKRLASVDEIKRALEVAEKIPCTYLIQHVGAPDTEYDDFKMEAAFSSLEEIQLFAAHRGVKVLLENIPNGVSSAQRLNYFLGTTHLDLGYCFDTGHARLRGDLEAEFLLMQKRIRSTHVHDNNGQEDQHLFPLLSPGGSIDWKRTMELFQQTPGQFPLVLELKERSEFPNPLDAAREVFDKLRSL